MDTKRMLVALAVAGASVLVACGESVTAPRGPATTAPTTVATTAATAPAPPDRSLETSLSGVGTVIAHTAPVAQYPGGPLTAIAAVDATTQGRVVIVLQDEDGWLPVSTLALPSPFYQFAGDTPIEVADVTGDGRPDFLVIVDAADAHPAVVVSMDGGTWRLVTDRSGRAYFGRDPHFVGGAMVSTANDCIPTCAEGKNTMITWTYDRDLRVFTPSSPL